MLNRNLEEITKKAGVNPNDEQLKQQLLSSLSKEDKEKLVKLLSNRQAVDEILKTPQAQELIRKYGKK